MPEELINLRPNLKILIDETDENASISLIDESDGVLVSTGRTKAEALHEAIKVLAETVNALFIRI